MNIHDINKCFFLLSWVNTAMAFDMFSILSLKSEMAFVTKSKGVCRSTLKSEDSSGSGRSKMVWQL